MMSVLGKKNMHIQGVFEQVVNLGDPGREDYTLDSVHRCVMGRELGKHRSIQVELVIDQYLSVNITMNIYTGL